MPPKNRRRETPKSPSKMCGHMTCALFCLTQTCSNSLNWNWVPNSISTVLYNPIFYMLSKLHASASFSSFYVVYLLFTQCIVSTHNCSRFYWSPLFTIHAETISAWLIVYRILNPKFQVFLWYAICQEPNVDVLGIKGSGSYQFSSDIRITDQ